MNIGSLFSGYGGLDRAIEQVFPGAELTWYADNEEAPSRVMERHWPDAHNYGDATTVNWGEAPHVDMIGGGSPCFAAGTPVLTTRGLIPIEDVTTDDKVWTHRGRWRKVTATMSRQADSLVEFRPGFYSTPEHKLYLRNPSRVWDNPTRRYRREMAGPEWVEAQYSKGQYAATPISVSGVESVKPSRLTWWQVGRFVADGYTSQQVNIYVGRDKEAHLEHFPGWTRRDQETAICMVLPKSSTERDWLNEHFGRGAHGKTIPAFVLSLPRDQRVEFLRGYWSGDGYKFSETATRSCSVSGCLTVGIQMLAASLGFTTAVHYNRTASKTVIEGREVNQRDWWSVTATDDDGRFVEWDDLFAWHKLRKEPPAHSGSVVYDLTVEDDHSFIAAGIVVHNCQDVSAAGKRAGMSEGTRSNLWVTMRESIAVIQPTFVVWENVRGAHSAKAYSAVEGEPNGYTTCICSRPSGRGGLYSSGRDKREMVQTQSQHWDDGTREVLAGGDAGGMGRDAVSAQEAHEPMGRGMDVAHDRSSSGTVPGANSALPQAQSRASAASSGGLGNLGATRGSLGRPEALDRGSERTVPGDSGPDGGAEHEGAGSTCEECGGDLSARAYSDMESESGRVGETDDPVIRATGRVLGDLSTLGYDAEWRTLPASSVGAPHKRDRVFVLAWRRDAITENSDGRRAGWWDDAPREGGGGGAQSAPSLTSGSPGGPGAVSSVSDVTEHAITPTDFGPYAPAIERWEQVLGRPVPAPTELSPRGKHRLSAAFCEFMMGLPEGWICDTPGVNRREAIKMAGNGVVPQQAYAALADMLQHVGRDT